MFNKGKKSALKQVILFDQVKWSSILFEWGFSVVVIKNHNFKINLNSQMCLAPLVARAVTNRLFFIID